LTGILGVAAFGSSRENWRVARFVYYGLLALQHRAQERAEKRGLDLGEDGFDFIPYQFGPWSYEVLLVLEDLQKEGLVEEIVKETSYGPRFRYVLTRKGRQVAEEERKAEEAAPRAGRGAGSCLPGMGPQTPP